MSTTQTHTALSYLADLAPRSESRLLRVRRERSAQLSLRILLKQHTNASPNQPEPTDIFNSDLVPGVGAAALVSSHATGSVAQAVH